MFGAGTAFGELSGARVSEHGDILRAVAARAADPATRTDEGAVLPLPEPLSDAALETSVARLGFRPPALFVDMLQAIGNGGFGPGYGFLGLEGGEENESGETAVDFYCGARAPDPEDPDWAWPEGLLAFCNWGCAMYTCLDCLDGEMRLMHWDPNVWEPGRPTSEALFAMPDTLPSWLAAWAAGENLWERLTGGETQS